MNQTDLVTNIRATRQRFMTLLAAIGALIYGGADTETLSLQGEATTALRSSRNWLGEVLKALGETNPYPTSADPTVATVEATADVPTDTGAQVSALFTPGMDLVAKTKTLRAQLKNEIQLLTNFWQNYPESAQTVQVLGSTAAPEFLSLGFIATENAMCAAIEANHALGWILAANGTVAEPTPIPAPVETPVIPIPGIVSTPLEIPPAIQPGTPLPNVDAPADSIPGSGTSGANSITPTPNIPEPQPETALPQDSSSTNPISTPNLSSGTGNTQLLTPSPDTQQNLETPPTGGTTTLGNPSPEPIPDNATPTPVIPVSDAQVLLNQIAVSYPKLINSVQEQLSLKQAQHIIVCYPDKGFRDEILGQLSAVQLEELDASGATSILSAYTSFMALAIQAEDEADGKTPTTPQA